jgi:hypothetical protein
MMLPGVLFAEETSKQLKALLASAADQNFTGRDLMAEATASMSSSADGPESMPLQDKKLVRVMAALTQE